MASVPQNGGLGPEPEGQAVERKVRNSRRTRARNMTTIQRLDLAEKLERQDLDDIAKEHNVPMRDVLQCSIRKLQLEMRHVMSIGLLRGMPELRKPVQSERRDGFGRPLPNGGRSRDGEAA